MITFRTLGKLGRFGNQLFQYAGTRLYAERNGYSCAMPDWIGVSLFQNVRPYTALEHLRARLLPTVQLSDMRAVSAVHKAQRLVRLWCRRDITELYEKPSDNIDLYGYLQDPFSLKLLAEHQTMVLSWFKWAPEIERAFREATKEYAPWVGVHVRRGDFVRLGKAVPTDLYTKELVQQNPKTPVFVSSDDASTRAEFRRFNLIRPTNPLTNLPDFIFDFWMLQQASTLYGCGSTFSWWAAYLGKHNYFSPPLTHLWPRGYAPALEPQSVLKKS